MICGIISKLKLRQVLIPSTVIFFDVRNNHSRQDSIDSLYWISLWVIRGRSGVDDIKFLGELTENSVNELGSIIGKKQFGHSPAVKDTLSKGRSYFLSSGSP